MNYLITGSSGFVGSNLCIYLENEGHKVYQCSRDLKNKSKVYFDLEKEKHLEIAILKKIDVLVHCAYNFNFNSLEKNRKINVSGSEKIFIAANKFKIKIIYISSISAFRNSYSIYGKIKKEIEDIANKYNAIIIRPGLIYSKQSQGGMFGSIVNLVKKIPILPLIDKGEQKLSYQDEPDSVANEDEEIIKVNATGICGSDIHAYHGLDERRLPPLILGHEISGFNQKDNNPVVINPLVTCTTCNECVNGREHICPNRGLIGMKKPILRQGGFAEFVSVPNKNIVSVPQESNLNELALTENP